MTRFLGSALAMLVVAGIASANITVTGDGKITYVPNIGTISAGVSSDAREAADAWKKNADIVKKIFDALKQQGIDPKDLKTTGVNISPNHIYPKGKKPQLVGYTATYNLDVTIRKLNEMGKTLDALVANGANRGMSISFTYDNLEQLLDQARLKAAAEARKKAELYVKGAGANLGAVVTIHEGNYFPPRPFYYEHTMRAAKVDLPIAVGRQDLSVTVTVTYTIENG
jgi:uncharacterized protein YggE